MKPIKIKAQKAKGQININSMNENWIIRCLRFGY